MGPTNPEIWNQPIPVPAETITFVDDAIIKTLPEGLEIRDISPSGASYWARTAKIEAFNADGEEDSYFLKVHQGEHGKSMVSAEFESMSALYKVMPEMVAKPVAWGSFESLADTHFFVCEFHEMSEDIPDVVDFPALVAEMHRRSTSPDGKFGYAYVTFGGRNPQFFPVTDTWEECFRKGMEGIFAAESQTHGPDEELQSLTKAMSDTVIPRLLRPMESYGRKVTPVLVHGDLWEGNASVDVATGSPMIFDATPLYAHNEYELGPWLCPRHKFPSYIDEYTKHFEKSFPAEEFNDRIELYCLRFDMHASSLYPGNTRFREISKDTMRKLLDRYSEGWEGYQARQGEAKQLA